MRRIAGILAVLTAVQPAVAAACGSNANQAVRTRCFTLPAQSQAQPARQPWQVRCERLQSISAETERLAAMNEQERRNLRPSSGTREDTIRYHNERVRIFNDSLQITSLRLNLTHELTGCPIAD